MGDEEGVDIRLRADFLSEITPKRTVLCEMWSSKISCVNPSDQ